MTEDVTHGLSLLADEAEPAPIDTHAVVAVARARTSRRRAVVASASVTLAAVGVLALTVTALREPADMANGAPTTTTTITVTEGPSTGPSASGEPEPGRATAPVIGTEVRQPATPEERAERAARLQQELTDAFATMLPDGWEYSSFRFSCDQFGCWARGDIVDGTGPVNLMIHVSGDYSLGACYGPSCTKQVMDDGTLVALNTEMSTPNAVGVDSVAPDGTSFSILAEWKDDRDDPLTDDQWRAFGNVVTY